MRGLALFLAFGLLCLTGPANARSTLEKYRELFTQMCWSVLQPERSVLKPEPRPNRLSPADCEGLAEEEATRMAAYESDPAQDGKTAADREFDVCMRLHQANQGQKVTDGFCRLSAREDDSWKINLNRFSELLLRESKGEREDNPEAARAYLLQVLPLGTSMRTARETLSGSGFDCSPDAEKAKLSCSTAAGYYTFGRSRGLTICGGEWIVELGPLAGESLQALSAKWIGGCL